MDIAAVTFRTTEAAAVASVDIRDINRAIDEDILPDSLVSKGGDREVTPLACALVAFYVASKNDLTSELRKSLIREAADKFWLAGTHMLNATVRGTQVLDLVLTHGFLRIDLGPFVTRASEGIRKLSKAKGMVETNSEILEGSVPVIRGTRIPVHDVAANPSRSIDQVLEDYPSLTREQVELARIFSVAYPPRGRPRKTQVEATGRLVSSVRVPRKRPA